MSGVPLLSPSNPGRQRDKEGPTRRSTQTPRACPGGPTPSPNLRHSSPRTRVQYNKQQLPKFLANPRGPQAKLCPWLTSLARPVPVADSGHGCPGSLNPPSILLSQDRASCISKTAVLSVSQEPQTSEPSPASTGNGVEGKARGGMKRLWTTDWHRQQRQAPFPWASIFSSGFHDKHEQSCAKSKRT